MIHRFLALFILLLSFSAQSQKSPKLIVGIVVDQMCYDYLYRFYPNFSKDGFRKLMQEGANCKNTQYHYVPTYTGPGHASIYTGTTPDNHGIVGNEWYDRQTKKVLNCVADSTVMSIGTSSVYGKKSPQNLKTWTVTDQLKLTYPESKVISLSIKDRSAIFPGGHLSNGSYWFDFKTGAMITSSFYQKELPLWVNQFNEQKRVSHYLTKDWELLRNTSCYVHADTSSYEKPYYKDGGVTFPYITKEILAQQVNANNYFTATPFANTFLTDFALEAIKSEELGKQHVDFLAISYSTPDIIGHQFGPYSREIEDVYLRLDLEIARLLKALDQNIGKDQYMLFLTADHGVVPVPQMLADLQMPGGYFNLNEKIATVRLKMKDKFGVDFIESESNQNIYLNHRLMDSLAVDATKVSAYLCQLLRQYPEVKMVIETYKFDEGLAASSGWLNMIQSGYHPQESGDVIFILEPGYLESYSNDEADHKGTSHGSAFNYDTHVPLIWYGKNIPKIDVVRPIDITDIAATLIHFLNLQRNAAMTGVPIVELFPIKK